VASKTTGARLTVNLGDVQGSAQVAVTTDASNHPVVTRNAYTPYGTKRGGSALAAAHGWLNQIADTTGLTYLNARYYDPVLGRFLSPDPVLKPLDPRTLDPYRYADNNPVMFVDPTGLEPRVWDDGRVTGVGGVSYTTYGGQISVKPRHPLGGSKSAHYDGPPPNPASYASGSPHFVGAVAALAAVAIIGGCAFVFEACGAAALPFVGLAATELETETVVRGMGATLAVDSTAEATRARVLSSAADSGTVFSGHGGIMSGEGGVIETTTVPKGTCIAFYCAHGEGIPDSLGNAIETGNAPAATEVFGPGSQVPNYRLLPPDGLNIAGNPVTVGEVTPLSELLKEGMGTCQWAACRKVY